MIKSKYFWILQAIGWVLFAVFVFFLNLQSLGNNWATYVVSISVFAGGFGWTTLYRYFIHRKGWRELPMIKVIFPMLVASLIVATIWTATFLGAYYITSFLGAEINFTWSLAISNLVSSTLVIVLWSVIYFSVNLFNQSQRMRVEKYKLETAYKDAQLRVLKSQINPHFMFNALNNIRALMLEDVHKSREMLTRLSELLRYSLAYGKTKTVTIGDELEITRNFIALNSIQFDQRLKHTFDVDPQCINYKIPPMLIQMLVENSIKHGISQIPEGGEIAVKVYTEQDHLTIEVSNTGTLKRRKLADGQNQNIGLKNIRERLTLLYGKNANFTLYESNGEVIANIKIPKNQLDL
ncbi:sensor histidine kinase [Halocola ammonii]